MNAPKHYWMLVTKGLLYLTVGALSPLISPEHPVAMLLQAFVLCSFGGFCLYRAGMSVNR